MRDFLYSEYGIGEPPRRNMGFDGLHYLIGLELHVRFQNDEKQRSLPPTVVR